MTKRNRRIRRGSYTIEAALLMPILLTVTFSLLFLTFFVHNRAWFTIAAYEAAVDGSMEAVRTSREQGERAAWEKARQRGENAFFGADQLQVFAKIGLAGTEVTYEAQTKVFPAGFIWNFSVKGSCLMIDPVLYIRTQRWIRS